jgi:hypothetical protein
MTDQLDAQLNTYFAALTDEVRRDVAERGAAGPGAVAPDTDLPIVGDEPRDPERRGRRVAWLVAAAVVAVAGLAVLVRAVADRTDHDTRSIFTDVGTDVGSGWTRLPDAPLAGRSAATVVTVDGRIYVLGGDPNVCPVNADCVNDRPLLADGAAFDPATGTWSRIADAPVGFRKANASVVVDGSVYLAGYCNPDMTETCANRSVFLRYRAGDDAWDVLPPAEGVATQWYPSLVALGGEVVALDGSPTARAFDVQTSTWRALPIDPLPAGQGHVGAVLDGELYVTTFLSDERRTLAAVYDPTTASWSELPEVGQPFAWGLWVSGGRIHAGPPNQRGPGRSFDPATGQWTDFPPSPDGTFAGVSMIGLMDAADATYLAYRGGEIGGWVLDTAAQEWRQIPGRPGVDPTEQSRPPFPIGTVSRWEETVGAYGNALLVFGGQRFEGDPSTPTMEAHVVVALNELWVWEPDRLR